MDLQQKVIQNEGDTPFFTDSKDDTSPPNKRAKHDADFDSSERKHDLDYYLPKQKHERGDEWIKLFQYRFYNSESREVFKDMTTKCEEEIQALKIAYDAAINFFNTEIAGLEEKQPGRITTDVLKTILDEQKLAHDYIRKADEMLRFVEVDVEIYIKYRDDILLKRDLLWEPYFESVKQLAEMPNVDKMIKFWLNGVGGFEPTEIHSLLSALDFSVLLLILRTETQSNFDDEEYNEDKEQFDPRKMTEVFNACEGSMRNISSLREAYQAADAEVKKQALVYTSDTYVHMSQLLQCLQCAVVQLGIIRQQMKLLYDKNVIEKGYYKLFNHDWHCCPFMV